MQVNTIVAPGVADVLAVVAATAHALPEQADTVVRARNFARQLISDEVLQTGENALAHTDAV